MKMPNSCTVEEEIYTHEYLWQSASMLLEKAEAQEQGSHHFLLPALLMSFMAYEAFINFCGYVMLPELWKEEKKHFKGKGIEGRLEAIITKLPAFSWRKGEPPYKRIKNLKNLRDSVAHAKVVATEYITERKEDGVHFQFKHPWDSYLSVEAVKSARTDIKSFCQSLIIELRKESDHLHLNFDAFEGSLASGFSMPKVD
jgi:hypothetical protein